MQPFQVPEVEIPGLSAHSQASGSNMRPKNYPSASGSSSHLHPPPHNAAPSFASTSTSTSTPASTSTSIPTSASTSTPELTDWKTPVWERARPTVRRLEDALRQVELKGKRREGMKAKIKGLLDTRLPKVYIAIYGATGIGKSSLINALLDSHLVPVNGTRACTATATEISYHDKDTFEADVSIVTEDEWKGELRQLQWELWNPETGTIRPVGELSEDSEVTLSKFKAIYPNLDAEQLYNMSDEEVLASDPGIRALFGTTQHFSASEPSTLTRHIKPYVDSQEVLKTKKKKKPAKRRKTDSDTNPNAEDDQRALWPLVKGLAMRCNADVLASGAVLVDLPGVGDANAARESVAKEYGKAAHMVFAAPIGRAVSDKLAKNFCDDQLKTNMKSGQYDPRKITIVTTKCDFIDRKEYRASDECDDDFFTELDDQMEAYEGMIETLMAERAKVTGPAQDEFDQKIKQIRAKIDGLLAEETILCSKQRSEVARVALQSQFKIDARKHFESLRASASQCVGKDGTQVKVEMEEDYDLPVFTCASVDYQRLRSNDPNDRPLCFTNLADTQIPALRDWIHELTARARLDATKTYIADLDAFVNTVTAVIMKNSSDVPLGVLDLKEKWDTGERVPGTDARGVPNSNSTERKPGKIARALITKFEQASEAMREDLDKLFEQYLVNAFQTGADKAIEQAPALLNECLDVPWQTLRAWIRRKGIIRRKDYDKETKELKGKLRLRDFNKELMEPFKKSVQDPWILVFKQARDENGNVFNQVRMEVEFRIRIIINDVCNSTKDPEVKQQVVGKGLEEAWMKEMRAALTSIESNARVKLMKKQKEYSQDMSARKWLLPGYEGAMAKTGPGCMNMQKTFFREYFHSHYKEGFDDTAVDIMTVLQKTASEVASQTDATLVELACKVEDTIALLWEKVPSNPAQLQARRAAKNVCDELRGMIQTWERPAVVAMDVD